MKSGYGNGKANRRATGFHDPACAATPTVWAGEIEPKGPGAGKITELWAFVQKRLSGIGNRASVQGEKIASTKDALEVCGLSGYARVSIDEQGTDPQHDELRDGGCLAIHEEHASGADRSRPVLARLLTEMPRQRPA